MEAAIESQREEVKDYKEKLIKQANMRKEFLKINAQLRDIKNIEKELVTIEIKQVGHLNEIKMCIINPIYYRTALPTATNFV